MQTKNMNKKSQNSVAKNQIDAFKASSITNEGFYIGRYEQGQGNVCKAGVNPYANITRNDAKTQAEAMYSGNEFVTSELISSYAWDTALNFICQTNEEGYLLATTTDSKYGNIGTGLLISNRTKTGEYEADNYSNIHDLLGNCIEWTTEYNSVNDDAPYFPGVYRGGVYDGRNETAASRNFYTSLDADMYNHSFRLQLYINPES